MDETQNTGTTRSKIIFGLLLFYVLSTLISMATMSVGVGAVALAFLLLDRKKERLLKAWKEREFRWYVILSALLISSAIFSLISAEIFPLPYQQNQPLTRYLSECRKLVYFLIPLVFHLTATDFTEDKKRQFLRVCWLLLGILGLIGIQQHFTAWPRLENAEVGRNHRYASVLFMGLSLSVASVFSLVLYPMMSRLFERILKHDAKNSGPGLAWVERPLFLTIAVIGLSATIFLTFSRMAWVSLPIGFFLLAALYSNKRMLAWIVVLTLGTGTLLVTFNPQIRYRLSFSGGYSDRGMLWKGHLELLRLRPAFGVGWRQNAKVVGDALRDQYRREGEVFPSRFFQSHAHNVWIEAAAGQGIYGLLTFLAWNLALGVYLLFKSRERNSWRFWYLGAGVGFVVLHLNGLTQVNFWDSKVFHQIMVLAGLAFFLGRGSRGPVSSSQR